MFNKSKQANKNNLFKTEKIACGSKRIKIEKVN